MTLDHDLIQNRGFANVAGDGGVGGFTLHIRMPSYRGMWASLIDGADVSVDGVAYDREATRWQLQGAEYSLDELRSSTGVRWQLEEAARLFVPKPGGLAVGVHEVSVGIRLRMSYIPLEYQPSVFRATRKVTIVE